MDTAGDAAEVAVAVGYDAVDSLLVRHAIGLADQDHVLRRHAREGHALAPEAAPYLVVALLIVAHAADELLLEMAGGDEDDAANALELIVERDESVEDAVGELVGLVEDEEGAVRHPETADGLAGQARERQPGGILAHDGQNLLDEVLAGPISVARHHDRPGMRLGEAPAGVALAAARRPGDGHDEGVLLSVGEDGREDAEIGRLDSLPPLLLEAYAGGGRVPLRVGNLVPVAREHL